MIVFFIVGECLLVGLMASAIALGGDIFNFIDIPSLIVIVGGVLAMAFMSFSWSEIKLAHRLVFSSKGNREDMELSVFFWECMIRNLLIVGILGTIIGIVQMLSSLENPDALGPSMAMGLITVFYSIVFNTMLPIPAYYRLKRKLNN